MIDHIEVERITPEGAKLLLQQNYNNRPLKAPHVNWLADQMKKGDWRMDGSPIRVAKSGRLLDGQHRLQAIINSNTSQDMLMVYGLDESVFATIDTGKNRTASDTLFIANVKDAPVTAAIVRMILNYERAVAMYKLSLKGKASKMPVTNQDILEFSQTVDLSTHIKKAGKWVKAQAIYTKAEYAFFYYVLSSIDNLIADSFLESLASGIGLGATSPIYVLREKLIMWKSKDTPPTGIDRLMLIFKAWNMVRADKPCSKSFVYDHAEDGFIIPQ